MTVLDRSHLDLGDTLHRTADRCRALGVHDYVLTIVDRDLSVVLRLVDRIEAELKDRGLGRVRRLCAPAPLCDALAAHLPALETVHGGTAETEVVLAFADHDDPDATPPAPEVRLSVEGPVGRIHLNRPKALNALSLGMIRAIDPQLRVWAADPSVRCVVITGEGGRAFCAGGDVRSVYDSGLADPHGADPNGTSVTFFREEYTLNHLIHWFPKPFVSLVGGIVMGGGVGLTMHGSHRVVGDDVVFAMPETGIGLFPDIGAGWFLPRFAGLTGRLIGLTGRRLDAADCLYAGYATHRGPAASLQAVLAALIEADWPAGDDRRALDATVDAVLARVLPPGGAGDGFLAREREVIGRTFAGSSIEAIAAALAAEPAPWAREALDTFASVSPTSLKVTLRQLQLGQTMTYDQVVTMEYRMSQWAMAHHDFYEGIRAVLVDKDKSPRWQPAQIEAVHAQTVEAAFQALGAADLVLAPPAGPGLRPGA